MEQKQSGNGTFVLLLRSLTVNRCACFVQHVALSATLFDFLAICIVVLGIVFADQGGIFSSPFKDSFVSF